MLRISAILTLVFYISVSIGVHVDVDTCCDSIAGVSMMSESEEHVETNEACCTAVEDSCCAQSQEETCSLDCIFIQILAEEQIASNTEKLRAAEQALFSSIDLLIIEHQDSQELSENTAFNKPPDISMNETLFLVHSSIVTYG